MLKSGKCTKLGQLEPEPKTGYNAQRVLGFGIYTIVNMKIDVITKVLIIQIHASYQSWPPKKDSVLVVYHKVKQDYYSNHSPTNK